MGIVIVAARGLVVAENKLFEYVGHIKLNRSWAYALFGRMDLVQRRPITLKNRMDWTDFATQKKAFLDDLVTKVQIEEYQQNLFEISLVHYSSVPLILFLIPYVLNLLL